MQEIIKKLNYKNQSPILVLDAPAECTALVQALSAIAEVHTSPQKDRTYDFCLAFCPAKKNLLENAERMHNNYGANAIIWFCYPKQTAPHYTSDLNRDRCWQYLEPYDLVPVRQVAIDDDWSALRYRREQSD